MNVWKEVNSAYIIEYLEYQQLFSILSDNLGNIYFSI